MLAQLLRQHLKYFAAMSPAYIEGKGSTKVFAKSPNLICNISYKYKKSDARKEKETGFLHEAICEIVENCTIQIYTANYPDIELKQV